MPHVLIFGATGTIGNAIALALVRSGLHTVYGLARSASKASGLAKQEIIPVQGSISEPGAFLLLLEQHPEISVVIDAAAAYGESETLLNHLISAGQERLEGWAKAGAPAGPKLGYIYVSGMWVHGSSPIAVSDINAFTGTSQAKFPPLSMVAWRPAIERLVLEPTTREVLDTAIARPACTYGAGSAIWGGPFSQLLQAARSEPQPSSVQIPLAVSATPPLVHVDDVAEGVRALAERLPLLVGTGVYPVFDFVGQIESLKGVMESAARAFGFVGAAELVGAAEGDVLAEALGATVLGDSGRAKALLGWEAKRKGFLEGMGIYAEAWRAGVEARG